eukprot:2719168-Karenia_brevis.AAC.1
MLIDFEQDWKKADTVTQSMIDIMMTTFNEGGARSSSESRSQSAEPRRKKSMTHSLSKELDSVDEE